MTSSPIVCAVYLIASCRYDIDVNGGDSLCWFQRQRQLRGVLYVVYRGLLTELDVGCCDVDKTAACKQVRTAACKQVRTAACLIEKSAWRTAACKQVRTAACKQVRRAACLIEKSAWTRLIADGVCNCLKDEIN